MTVHVCNASLWSWRKESSKLEVILGYKVEFEASLGYISPCLKIQSKTLNVCWQGVQTTLNDKQLFTEAGKPATTPPLLPSLSSQWHYTWHLQRCPPSTLQWPSSTHSMGPPTAQTAPFKVQCADGVQGSKTPTQLPLCCGKAPSVFGHYWNPTQNGCPWRLMGICFGCRAYRVSYLMSFILPAHTHNPTDKTTISFSLLQWHPFFSFRPFG